MWVWHGQAIYEDTVQYNHMTNLNSLHTFLEFPTDVCVEALEYALRQAFKLFLMGQIVELHNDIHDGSGAQYSRTLMVTNCPCKVANAL